MGNKQLQKWIQDLIKDLEQKREKAGNTYVDFIHSKSYAKLLNWAEDSQYDIGQINRCFSDLIETYIELINRLGHLESHISKDIDE